MDFDTLLQVLEARERELAERGDPGVAFAAAYVVVTQRLRAAHRDGRFQDPDWIERYATRFGERYLGALEAWQSGRRGAIPAAWRMAFEAAENGSVLASLLLGLSAHINHDLPLVLAECIADGQEAQQAEDFQTALQVVASAIDPIQRRVGVRYGRGLLVLDLMALRLDEAVTYWIIRAWRQRGWARAIELRDNPLLAPTLRAAIDRRACRIAGWLALPFSAPRAQRFWNQLERIDVRPLTAIVRTWDNREERHVR